MKFTFGAALATATLVSATSYSNTSLPTNSTSNFSCAKQCKPFTIEVADGTAPGSQLVSRQAILTNGTLPGPPLKLKVGDCVDFKVINHMSSQTGVHFHGIRQLETPWADGTPGLTQYAIKSGDSYTYRWVADEVGVYFYHSHYKAQMMDGMYGAIVISDDNVAAKPFATIGGDLTAMVKAEANVNTVFAADWNQYTAQQVLDIEANANIDYACTDSITLNGQGSSYCLSPAALIANERPQVPQILGAQNQSLTAKGCIPASNIPVQGAQYTRNLAAIPAGAYDQCTPSSTKNMTISVDAADKYAAVSFISPAGVAILSVTIDGHKLIVYEINGHYINPQTVDTFNMSPGDRISCMVKLDQAPADYTIRIANGGLNQVISGFGVLSYKGSSGPSSAKAIMNYGGVFAANTTVARLNPFGAAPYGAAPAMSSSSDRTFNLDIMKNPTDGEGWSWILNQDSFSQSNDDQTPILFAGPSNVPASNLVLKTNYNEWVDLIIKIAGPLAQPHPIHKHANKFYVIGAGTGDFNYSSVAQAQAAGVPFNMANPPYVDGYTSAPAEGSAAWMVFRYQANTPGAWYLHCHIQTHFSGGMAVAIMDAVDKWPTLPANPGNVCANNGTNNNNGTSDTWSAWNSASVGTNFQKGTKTVVATSTAADWSVWNSIVADASSSTAKWGVASTILVGATPNSQPIAISTGNPGAWSSPVASTRPTATSSSSTGTWGTRADPSSTAKASSSSSTGSWSAWSSSSSSSSSVKASSTSSSSSTWASWSSSSASSTPVKAASTSTGSSTWATWSSSSTPVAAASGSPTWSTYATPAASASGNWAGSYNGTNSPVAAFTGAASTLNGSPLVVSGLLAGLLALLA